MYVSSLGAIYRAMHDRLKRPGVKIGSGAGYPRVEIHSFSEGNPLDKGRLTRQVTCIVESMSTRSLGDAVGMNDENISRLLDGTLSVQGFSVNGIMTTSLTDMTESADTQEIIYRLLQGLTITLTQE